MRRNPTTPAICVSGCASTRLDWMMILRKICIHKEAKIAPKAQDRATLRNDGRTLAANVNSRSSERNVLSSIAVFTALSRSV